MSAFTALLHGPRRNARDESHDAEVVASSHACRPTPPGRVELGCYSQMYSASPEVRTPCTLAELEAIFAEARDCGRRVTFRAGGNAFDAQALNDDLVISLERFDEIGTPDTDDLTITVGAGARWGDILDTVSPLGLVPAIMVTTENATAGGTLSGNCLSRFSPTYGKEGRWVRGFEILTTAGDALTCTPPPDDGDPESWSTEQRVFMAAIGGLGYIGAVHRITYQLVRACRPEETGLAVRTTLRKHKDYADLASDLLAKADRMRCDGPAPHGVTLAAHEPDQAIYSALIRRVNARRQAAVVLTSTYTTKREGKALAIHQPRSAVRFVAEMLLRTRLDWILTLFSFHLLMRQSKTYTDDLRGFTFFMDGNARVKAWGKRHGIRMPTVQQTFIVPFDPDGPACDREDKLARWLDESNVLMREHRVRPTFSDILFINDTLHFGLSANAGKAGFAVSYAFETGSRRRLARITALLELLAEKLTEPEYDGRVYLVKNVYASQATLRAMYGDNVRAFLEVKRDCDPDRLLDNDFLGRAFGDLADEVYAERISA